MRLYRLVFTLLLVASPVSGHQLQTQALFLEERARGEVSVRFKTSEGPAGRASRVAVVFSPGCEPRPGLQQVREQTYVIRSWHMHCEGGLQGRTLELQGLGPSAPDAVVTVQYLSGDTLTQVLDRQSARLTLGAVPGASAVYALYGYLPIGIVHILAGPDHLLFVLCLLLVVNAMQLGWLRLVATLTAFTLAHSLTLAASLLYGLTLPPAPVEAVIALSILLLCVELARHYRQPMRSLGLSLRYPAAIAFLFGLLHGFGFAGALADIGLPAQAQGWALLLFNLGVEVGQLLFVFTLLTLVWLSRAVLKWRPEAQIPAVVSAIGAVSAYWLIDRLWPVLMHPLVL